MIRLLLVGAFACISLFGQSQNAQIVSSVFSPSPLDDCTSATATVQVQKFCINLALVGANTTVGIDTTVVRIDYSIGPICLGALAQVQESVSMGQLLSSNSYITVQLAINGVVVTDAHYPITVQSCCPVTSAFSASALDICPGDSVFFANSSSGANTYRWYFENTQMANTTDFGMTFNQPGTYDISLVATDGNCKDSTTESIFVIDASVDLGADTSICAGDTILLDAGNAPDSTHWSTGTSGRYLSVSQAGTYIAETHMGSCFGFDTIVIASSMVPSVSLGADTTICEGDSILLDATQSFAASYSWNLGSTTSSIWVKDAGVYFVEVISSGGCAVVDSIEVDTDSCDVSVSERSLNYLFVYPNPAQSEIVLRLDQWDGPSEIVLVDLKGGVVVSDRIDSWSEEVIIDISSVPVGVYLIRVESDGQMAHQRLIIHR